MKKNIYAMLIAAATAGAVLPAEAIKIISWNSLQTQLDLGGVVTLTHDLSATGGNGSLTVEKEVTLDLNGHTLDAAGLFGAIVIYSGGHLTLTNSVPGSGAITGGSCNNGAGVYVYGGGRFTMAGGTISGNTANVYGGGVYVDHAMDDGGEGAAFEMTGGMITGNFAWYGGGVHIEGETECWFGEEGDDDYYSTWLAAGRFTMTGGMITGNGATDDGDGGGVHVTDENTLSLSGAPIISGNTNSVGSANNVYLGVSGRIDVGPLSEGASIGVTTYLEPEVGSPVAVSSFLASTGDSEYFFSDNPDFSLGLISDELYLIDPSAASYWDPQGTYIWDSYVIEWLSTNGITQADIDALGDDYAAMEKMYACYMLNCDFRVQDAGATINLTDITVSNGVVSVTVQLTRKAPLGAIKGYLYFYGARDLADGFDSSPIQDASVSFGADDPTFATAPTTGSVTQTATATFSFISYKFFKAAIHAYLPNNGDEPWEEPGEPWEPEEEP